MRELFRVSWLVVRRSALNGPAGAALALVLFAWPVLDDGWALQVLQGAGVLLAVAAVAATDDPGGEVLAASPISRRVRTAARFAAAAIVVVPAGAAVALVVDRRAPDVPVAGAMLGVLGLTVCGLAAGAGIRAWAGNLRPSFVTAPVVAALALLAYVSPRAWAMLQSQTWGPPWEAAQWRWLAVLLAAVALLALALRDPLDRGTSRTM